MVRRDDVRRFIKVIIDKRVASLEPVLNAREGLVYGIEKEIGVSCETLHSVLRELRELGIMRPLLRGNYIACPRCGSHSLMIQLYCPSCGSLRLIRDTAVEHITCGFTDLEERFERSDGRLVCPKCRKELRGIGIDYRKPGIIYRCSDCGDRFAIPRERYTCINGHVFEKQEASFQPVYAYIPDPVMVKKIENKLVDLKPIVDELVRMGWQGLMPASIVGISGVEHEFSLALWRPGKRVEREGPDIVVDIYVSELGLSDKELLAFIAKCHDLEQAARDPLLKIVLAIPGLTNKAKTLAEKYGIVFVEATSADELVEKAKMLLIDVVMSHGGRTAESIAQA